FPTPPSNRGQCQKPPRQKARIGESAKISHKSTMRLGRAEKKLQSVMSHLRGPYCTPPIFVASPIELCTCSPKTSVAAALPPSAHSHTPHRSIDLKARAMLAVFDHGAVARAPANHHVTVAPDHSWAFACAGLITDAVTADFVAYPGSVRRLRKCCQS